MLGYSRDGFHWHRPVRSPFIAASRKEGSWNRAYIHAAGGGCLVVKDKIYFYFGAWSGESPTLGRHMYAGGNTGLAILRRDGNGQLYSFWVSPDLTGASDGYVAAGGPGFTTAIDTVGSGI